MVNRLIETVIVLFAFTAFLACFTGCVTAPRNVSVACFADEEARKAKRGVTGEFPIIVTHGQVMFYDADGVLHRVKEATCGLRGDQE
jgi:hypothetical protein